MFLYSSKQPRGPVQHVGWLHHWLISDDGRRRCGICFRGRQCVRNGVDWKRIHRKLFWPSKFGPRFQPLFETLMSFGLFQLNNLENSSGNVLDLAFTNINHDVILSESQCRRLSSYFNRHHQFWMKCGLVVRCPATEAVAVPWIMLPGSCMWVCGTF